MQKNKVTSNKLKWTHLHKKWSTWNQVLDYTNQTSIHLKTWQRILRKQLIKVNIKKKIYRYWSIFKVNYTNLLLSECLINVQFFRIHVYKDIIFLCKNYVIEMYVIFNFFFFKISSNEKVTEVFCISNSTFMLFILS